MDSDISSILFSSPPPPPPTTVDSSSLIIADNFSHLKAPKPEPTEDLNSYDLPPLPDLLSLEPPPPPLSSLFPEPPIPIIAGDLVFRYSSSLPSPPLASRNSTRTASSSSEMARRRRSKISDRMKVLASLMPWSGTRMSMGTQLEEAVKYVKFLEAQVAALETMPVRSGWTGPVGVWIGRFGGLDRVNRQQLLGVSVNSSGVQNVLYKKGYCVFSAEQVAELRQSPVMLLPAGSSAVSW